MFQFYERVFSAMYTNLEIESYHFSCIRFIHRAVTNAVEQSKSPYSSRVSNGVLPLPSLRNAALMFASKHARIDPIVTCVFYSICFDAVIMVCEETLVSRHALYVGLRLR